jgi:hypothetical protein
MDWNEQTGVLWVRVLVCVGRGGFARHFCAPAWTDFDFVE